MPYDQELFGKDEGLRQYAGTHIQYDFWGDPVEYATSELDRALSDLAVDGPRLGMQQARIVLWAQEGIDSDPAVVIPATDEQLAIGRLRVAVEDVEAAERALEEARARLRSQIVASRSRDHLRRDRIAAVTDHTWADHLVLQYLAGYDLVEAVRRALPSDWSRMAPYYDEDREPGQEHLSPYWCGSVRLDLAEDGQVRLGLAIDGPDEDPSVINPHASEEDIATYHRKVAQRAQVIAEQALPCLHRAGIHLTTPEGAEAQIADIAAAWRSFPLLVVTRPQQRVNER